MPTYTPSSTLSSTMAFVQLYRPSHLLLLICLHFICIHQHYSSSIVDALTTTPVHIVYMGEKKSEDPATLIDSHHNMLTTLLGSKEAAMDSLLYNYMHGFSGFAARLTEAQAKHISGFPGVVRVIPNTIHKLHTTRSWDFLDLNSPPPPMNHSSNVNMGDGAIIGVIDTGIWPESPSFRDEDMGPIPSRWKGICQEGEHFNHTNCNKKIIGARWFIKGLLALMEGKRINTTLSGEFLSPRSAYGYGHGTHTASTAAGRLVHNASYKGLGAGLARGGAPLARLAIYKSCWNLYGCATADILKAFDEAIHDGIDVLSVSLSSPSEPHSYIDQRDAVNIGSFHAVAKGITVVCSGGNSGPSAGTVKNTAPWIINVAATTIDRSFPAPITLGNNQTYMGQSLSSGKSKGRRAALVFAGDVGMDGIQFGYCEFLFLNSSLTAGKVVLCFSLEGGSDPSYNVADAGGVGVIMVQNPTNSLTPCENVTCVSVDYEIGAQILSYIQSSRSPSVKLSPAKSAVGMSLSTKVAYFSSRGPSPFSPAVLKPDIAAPGVNILAAWPPENPANGDSDYKTEGGFSFATGTSMACPHVAGVAARIKSAHPEWSPAAIKSALVTTASVVDRYGESLLAEGAPRKVADPFDYGGGLVNPKQALEPGLIYDMTIVDHVQFLCSMGYNNSIISSFTGQVTSCATHNPSSILNLNLPSMVIPSIKREKETIIISRTVTNVGPINSVYKPLIQSPPGIKVDVTPEVLIFNASSRDMGFKMSFFSTRNIHGEFSFGSLTWSDGKHVVRSPIAVRSVIYDSYADV